MMDPVFDFLGLDMKKREQDGQQKIQQDPLDLLVVGSPGRGHGINWQRSIFCLGNFERYDVISIFILRDKL